MTTNTRPRSQHDLSYQNTLFNSDYDKTVFNSDYNKTIFNTTTVILSSGN